jgi:hypothetical protein
MSRLKPYELLARDPVGIKHAQVKAMLEHYGFRRDNVGKSSPHMKFVHREFGKSVPVVQLPVHNNGYDLEPAFVRDAAKACIRVDEMNAARKAGGRALDALPEWLAGAFGPEFKQAVDATNVLRLTHGLNGSPARSYEIRNEKGVLRVQSVEFAGDADYGFEMRFEGERKPVQAFLAKFNPLDKVVAGLIAEGAVPKPEVPNPSQVAVVERTKGVKQASVNPTKPSSLRRT